jgi:hypothetical protein
LRLFPSDRLDLGDKDLGHDGFLVGVLDVDALMIERLEVVLGVGFPPNSIPLAKGSFPLFVLLLEASNDNGNSHARVFVKRVKDMSASFWAIDLLDPVVLTFSGMLKANEKGDLHSLISGPTHARVQTRFQAERLPLERFHQADLLGDGLQNGQGAKVGFDVPIVLVALFFRSMESSLKVVIANRDLRDRRLVSR